MAHGPGCVQKARIIRYFAIPLREVLHVLVGVRVRAVRPSSSLAPYGRDPRSIAAFMTCNQSDVLQIIAAFTADNEAE